jgi:hypothetical protein
MTGADVFAFFLLSIPAAVILVALLEWVYGRRR